MKAAKPLILPRRRPRWLSSYWAVTASALSFTNLINIGVMLKIRRHRGRWRSDFRRRYKTNRTMIR
jgi:hypothetical protein